MDRHIPFLLVILAMVISIALGVSLRRTSRAKRKPLSGGFAWALLFLSGGRMPPPPPQSQIEQDVDEKKNSSIGRSRE